ncbi:hypothetical protein IQ06DRAFT_295379 [Phaeosphaeriaceae sp. SRC1lsM3a]|nr:hypothetical protein IQ06DRAFT_295379 [Stagonospora sp. SRC1lsM3a]
MFSFKLVITILALAVGTTADMWTGFENLSEGLYSGTVNADGSTNTTASSPDDSVTSTYHFDLIPDTAESQLARRSLDKRDT